MNVKKMKESIDLLKADLDGALLSSDIWDKESGSSITSFNPNDKYTALFGSIVNNMENSLNEIGLPPFGKYQIIDLEVDAMLLILNVKGKYLWGSLIDKTHISLGFLINISIPKARASLIEATSD